MRADGIYHRAIRGFARLSFPLCQALGFYIVPRHFYHPIPDTRVLPRDLWERQSELVGVVINEATQLELLSTFVRNFRSEYEAIPRERPAILARYFINCGFFESVDGEVLYCMTRHFQPRRIFEIGSGMSTLLSAQAHLKNQEHGAPACELVAFEPYPNATLKAGFPGLTRLVETRIQDVPVSEFQQLEANDILFVDSSHMLRIGSDVVYEFLEIIPRLHPGVVIHVHDIFFPEEYSQNVVLRNHYFWNEQYLLQAFLAFNRSFEVLWAGNYMRLRHSHRLQEAFSSYDPHHTMPGSLWMRKLS